MTQKYVTELTKEELTTVFYRNMGLQADVLNDMLDSELFCIDEKLAYVKAYLSRWSISADRPCFIEVKTGYKDMVGFLKGLTEMGANVPAFTETEGKLIVSQLSKAISAYIYAPMDADNYSKLERDAIQATKEAAEALANQFESDLEWCYDTEHKLEYFLEFYSQERLNEEAYIIPEEGTYQLYEDVHYTKTY